MSKKVTSTGAASSLDALNENYLQKATEAQLVSRLLDVITCMEGAAAKEAAHQHLGVDSTANLNTANHTNNNTNNTNNKYTVIKAHKGMVAELAKREYTASPSADVQVSVACSLSCALGGGPLAARGAPNPIPKDVLSDAQCSEVLRLIVGTVQRLQSEAGTTSYASYIRRMLEQLAARHGIHSLLARLMRSPAHASEGDEAAELLVQTLLSTAVEDDAVIGQMASLICDVIEANQSLTDGQLQLLLTALTAAAGSSASASAAVTTPRRVALAVLRRKEEVVAAAVSGFLVHEVEAAVEGMIAADVAAVDDASEEAAAARKAAVKRVGAILESCVAVCRVGVNIASGIVPRLQTYLSAEHNDIRLVFTRTFARTFLASPVLAQSFTPAYHAFLGRFVDARVPIRSEMLKYAKEALAGAPMSDDLWLVLGQALENKLIDADESVRRSAIAVVVDTALTVPRRVPNKVYANLAARCKDKVVKVRAYAIERLSELFLKTRLQWIPNAIFASAQVPHAEVSLVEFAVNDMLPKPVDASASAGVQANRKKQTTLLASKQKTMYKFDFEGGDEDGASSSAATKEGADDKKNVIDTTFLGSFVQLCGCFDDMHWQAFLTLMQKKATLRLTLLRFVQIRQALKAKQNVEKNKEIALRLIAFIAQKTGVAQGPVSALFMEADDSATKWLHQLCDEAGCKDFFQHGEVALEAKVKGRSSNDVYKYLSSNLLRRLCLPIAEKDVTALVEMIDADRKKEPKERLAAIRALEAVVRMCPQIAFAIATPYLARWVKEDSEAIRRGQNPALSKVMGTLLNTLADIGIHNGTGADSTGGGGAELPKAVMERKSEIIATLGKICLSSEDGKVAKRSALCLANLFKGQTNAFQQLMLKVQEKLGLVAAQGESAIGPTTVSLVKTFAAFVTTCPDAIVVSADLIAEHVTSIMLTAVRAHREEDDIDAAVASKKNPNGPGTILTYPCLFAEVVDACAKALTRHALSLPGHSAAAQVPEVFNSLWKAFRETHTLPTGSVGACKRRLALHKQLLRLLIKGEAILASAGAPHGGAAVTTKKGRDGQSAATTSVVPSAMLGNLELMRKELSVVAMISSEDNDDVRRAVQKKLADIITKSIPLGRADTRRVAMLCMTAIAEDSKAGYHALKALFADVADRFAASRAQHSMTLMDPNAPKCFLEYAVPALVLYMAHHTTYALEKAEPENPFRNFQRPWQLLFDEMLKESAEPAGALQEMFRRLRAMDDAVPNPPEEDATRVICDLGCKVLLTILEEKSVPSTGAPFPGGLLLPWYFVRTAEGSDSGHPYDRVYLPPGVVVTPRPLFGAPVGFLVHGAAGKGVSQSVARGPSRSVAPSAGGGGVVGRSMSLARSAAATGTVDYNANDNDNDDNDNDNSLLPAKAKAPEASPAKGKAGKGAGSTSGASAGSKRARDGAHHVDDTDAHQSVADAAAASPQPRPHKNTAAAAATAEGEEEVSNTLANKRRGAHKGLRSENEGITAGEGSSRAASATGNAAAAADDNGDDASDPSPFLAKVSAVMASIDVGALGDDCPPPHVQRTIASSIASTMSKYSPAEVKSMKFGEIRIAVQESLGRKWSDGEKDYAKLFVVAFQEK